MTVVAVPPPVAPMVNVEPEASGVEPVPIRFVPDAAIAVSLVPRPELVPAFRPSEVRIELVPPMVRPVDDVPELRTMEPDEIVAVPDPAMSLMALVISPTVPLPM